MVRHAAPPQQPIPYIVEKVASASASVEIVFNTTGGKILETFSLVRTQLSAYLVGVVDDTFSFRFNLCKKRVRQGIRPAKSDEVRSAILFPVGQTSPIPDRDLTEAGARRPRDSRRDADATPVVLNALLYHLPAPLPTRCRWYPAKARKSRTPRWPTCQDRLAGNVHRRRETRDRCSLPLSCR